MQATTKHWKVYQKGEHRERRNHNGPYLTQFASVFFLHNIVYDFDKCVEEVRKKSTALAAIAVTERKAR